MFPIVRKSVSIDRKLGTSEPMSAKPGFLHAVVLSTSLEACHTLAGSKRPLRPYAAPLDNQDRNGTDKVTGQDFFLSIERRDRKKSSLPR